MNIENIKIENYCIEHSEKIPDYLIDLEKETNLKTTMPQMLTGRIQGRLLSFLSKMINPKSILEIGTFTGYSALCLAEGLQENGILRTYEVNNENISLIKKIFQLSPFNKNIELIEGDALKLLKNRNEKYDIVYIDANKNDYPEYYKLIIDKVNSNGLILIDNVLWSGKVIFDADDKTASILRDFNIAIKNDTRVEKIMLPIRDGLSIIRKK
ncbi:MAG: class I SAM-dependent methyltransferase [Saprospiraceae bacterium]